MNCINYNCLIMMQSQENGSSTPGVCETVSTGASNNMPVSNNLEVGLLSISCFEYLRKWFV